MIFKGLIGKLFGTNRSLIIPTNLDQVENTKLESTDVESVRLNTWLQNNYTDPLRDSETEMVVSTGRDFYTNQPTLRLIPKIPKSPKRKYQSTSCTVSEDILPINFAKYPNNTSYLFQSRDDWVDSLFRSGELVISRYDHSGNVDGLRGASLAFELAESLKRYLRENGIKPRVEVTFNGGRKTIVRMEEPAHEAYSRLIKDTLYQTTA